MERYQHIYSEAAARAARIGKATLRFEDFIEAIRNLTRDERFPPPLVAELERLPGFRNILVHEYVALDMDRVVEALNRLEPVVEFLRTMSRIESSDDGWRTR